MQKRGRAVETQKLKRTMKARKTATVRETTNNFLVVAVKLVCMWASIISMDLISGIRVELLWPCWMLLRSFYESMQRRAALIHLTGQTTTFLFVCVTATSDLICYLFIPVRLLIFLATTYVWMNLVWHFNGGFLMTVKTLLGDKAQAAPVVFLWSYFVFFEIFARMRCDFLGLGVVKYLPFISWLEEADGCLHVQGMRAGFQQAFNAFFSAHCIGYPLIIISFNAKYYYKEWRLRAQQGDVSDDNESLFRMLADAIPMEFDATRMYRRAYDDDECLDDDFLENGDVLPIEAPPSEKPFHERYANCNLANDKQLLMLMSGEERRAVLTPRELRQFEKSERRREERRGESNTNTPVTSPAENMPSSSYGVQRRHNGAARPSISSRSSRANGKLQQAQQSQQSNGRRTEKEKEEGGEDWPDCSSSDSEVQLNRRRAARTAPLVVRAIVGVATRFFDLILLIANLIPIVRRLSAVERRWETFCGRTTSEQNETVELPNGKSASLQATPPAQLTQHSTPPSRKNTRSNGVNGVVETGGGRRRGDNATQNGTAANGRSSRHDQGGNSRHSNGLGLGHQDLDSSAQRDVSRDSARTQNSEESGELQRYSNGGVASSGAAGRMCGVECGKLASEVARLRTEVRQVRQAEEAARLHATNCANGEKNAEAESSQLRARIEQLINKVSSVERQRDQERATSAVAERKASESSIRISELERELQKERVERREERERGREKSETVSETQQLLREKEAAWERESERLRNSSRTKDAVILEMQAELTKLRVVAKSAVEAEDLRAELSLLRDKTAHLEANLAEENKLKQELFRALRNTQAERDRARQYENYSSHSAFYPLSPTLGSPGSNGTHSVIGGGAGYSSAEMSHPPAHSTRSCAAEQAFGGGNKHSYSFASPSTHTSSFLSSGTGQHTLFDPLPMPPTSGGTAGVNKSLGFPLAGEEIHEDNGEPFYAQNCGKFGAPSPASARTTTS